MKKLIIFVFLTILYGYNSFGQDLIVTNKGDSINCKINKERGDFIHFTFSHDQEIRETLLQKSQIKTYSKGYFPKSEIPTNYKLHLQDDEKIRVAVNGGYSYRFAEISESVPSEYHDYMKKLKSGNHFSLDASYFINETIGLGIKYSRFHTREDFGLVNTDIDQDGIMDMGQMKDDMNISFLGPMFTTSIPSANKKNAFFSSLAMGYLEYKDDGEMIVPMLLEGSTIGFVGDLGYQVGIAKNLAIAFTLSYTLGHITKIKSTISGYTTTIELDKDNYENLGRIDFSIGFVFHK